MTSNDFVRVMFVWGGGHAHLVWDVYHKQLNRASGIEFAVLASVTN